MNELGQILTPGRLKSILAKIKGLNVGVVGDLALDAYWYADMKRSILSRETPHFPRPIIREIYGPGAGANVAQNVKAIGAGQVWVLSVIGKDWRGETLCRELNDRDIHTDGLVVSSERFTTAYIKPMLMGFQSQEEDSRLDFENSAPLSSVVEDDFLAVLEDRIPRLDAVLIADQMELNGVITPRVRKHLCQMAGKYTEKIFLVDSRVNIHLFENMSLKPNDVEASRAVFLPGEAVPEGANSFVEAARRLHAGSHRAVYITLGKDGVLVYQGNNYRFIPAAPVKPPLDTVGAGDTFISALGAGLAAGAVPDEAGVLASLAAGVTVEKLNQTGTASEEEIMARYDLAQNMMGSS